MHQYAAARVGDTLSLRIRVVDGREAKSKPDLGVVTIYHELYNQKGDIVFIFDDALLVRKSPASE